MATLGKKLDPGRRLEIVEATAPTSDVTEIPPPPPAGQHGGLRAGVNVLPGRQIQIRSHLEWTEYRYAARLEARVPTALV